MSVKWARIGSVATLQRRAVEVNPSTSYTEIGLRSFARGVFLKPPISGSDLGGKRVFRIEPGDLLVSNVFAWEGAVAVADGRHVGTIGSHRFMTWHVTPSLADPRYLRHYFAADAGLEKLRQASPGSAGRNRTLSISGFEAIEIPLPSLNEQRRIADYLDGIERRVLALNDNDHVAPLPMLPGLVEQVFSRAAIPMTTVGELCDSTSRTVHPGADRGGATDFIGLEHIEPHTGRQVGSRPLGDEKGRKLRFLPGEITYGYLRPYLNKVWVADSEGLCSVEQYVLRPKNSVDATALSFALRSQLALRQAIAATHTLQLPRLRLALLMSMTVPDVRLATPAVKDQLDQVSRRVTDLDAIAKRRRKLVDGLLPAARNEIFSAMR